MNNMPLVEVKGVCKSYDSGLTQALIDVNLILEKGKIYALMGPSGCGKSTLLNLIGALDEADSGVILYEGKKLQSLGDIDKFRQKFLGFIFQFHHLIPVLTLEENVEAALLTDGKMSSLQRKKKATSLLKEVGLEHKMYAFASEISGGERQRGAIARALVNEPILLLADEPTGNVDSKTAVKILDVLHLHVKSKGGTILMATHDPEVAAIADICIMMEDGKIISIQETKVRQ
jgi:putative ABC transport system ATP-binding protein